MLRRARVRAMIVASMLAIVIVGSIGPSIAAASDGLPTATQLGPAFEPEPSPPTPKTKLTPKPKSTPRPKSTPKPKPRPTPATQAPDPGEQAPVPGGAAPDDPNPVRPDEPPAAPGTTLPEAAGDPAHEDGDPRAPDGQAAGTAADPMTGPAAPLSPSVGRPPSRVQLVVAGATVSGIAGVAAWLVLGGRRRERASIRVLQPSGTSVTLAPKMKLDLDVVRTDPKGTRQGRYAGRVLAWSATTLWRAEDDRPRWIRRFDEQLPPRVPVRNASLAPEEEPMPWLAAMTWSAGDESDSESDRD